MDPTSTCQTPDQKKGGTEAQLPRTQRTDENPDADAGCSRDTNAPFHSAFEITWLWENYAAVLRLPSVGDSKLYDLRLKTPWLERQTGVSILKLHRDSPRDCKGSILRCYDPHAPRAYLYVTFSANRAGLTKYFILCPESTEAWGPISIQKWCEWIAAIDAADTDTSDTS